MLPVRGFHKVAVTDYGIVRLRAGIWRGGGGRERGLFHPVEPSMAPGFAASSRRIVRRRVPVIDRLGFLH